MFAPELPGLDRGAIREWYNGYSWLGGERVYNPFDILLLFRSREFKAHWLETGTPTFLVDTLFRRRVRSVDFDGMLASDELLSAFDVDEIAPEALLFQTGYLTIREREDLGGERLYRLGYPNREVRQGLNRSLLRRLGQDGSRQTANGVKLRRLLEADDVAGLRDLFHAFFAGIPHQWYANNDIADYEGFYASVFYSYFAGLGLDVTVEDSTNRGRLDMAVRFEGRVYVFEFKVVEQAGEGAAMAQLLDRGYADKYRSPGVRVHLVGVEFSSASRNVVGVRARRGVTVLWNPPAVRAVARPANTIAAALDVAHQTSANDVAEPHGNRVANQASENREPRTLAGRHELIGLRQCLKHGRFAQRNRPVLLRMPEPPVTVPEALRRNGGCRGIPFHTTVDARIRIAGTPSVAGRAQLWRPVPPSSAGPRRPNAPNV